MTVVFGSENTKLTKIWCLPISRLLTIHTPLQHNTTAKLRNIPTSSALYPTRKCNEKGRAAAHFVVFNTKERNSISMLPNFLS